jgi:Uma2 family endonuclease
MATVGTSLMTADEFWEWLRRPENQDRSFELERGGVVEMPPPSKYHGFVCGNVAGLLWSYAIRRGKGYPCTNDAGIVVEKDPDTVRGPDVSFYEDEQTPETMDRKFATQPPRLVVEVLSPNDQGTMTVRRVSQFLRRGVPLVWIVDPEVRSVMIYRSGKDVYVVDDTEELTGEDVLPDFRCAVADLFTLPGKRGGP